VTRAVDARQDGARMFEEGFARWEELHATWRACEERRADLVFERSDLPAHGRLSNVEALGCTSDMALLSDGDEVTDLREAHAVDREAFMSAEQASLEIETVLDASAIPGNAGKAWRSRS
jgi:hypothetical protein